GRQTIGTAPMLPSTAPSPKAAKNAPATFELAYSSYASTVRPAPSICPSPLATRAVSPSTRSRGSRSTAREPENTQQAVPRQECDPGGDPPAVVGLRTRGPRRDEQEEQREGDQERRGVDIEHARRVETPAQDARH